MAQIYGELIRAQLQVSASDLGSPAAGLIYFNSTTGAKWYSGSAWKTAVDLDSSQTLANKSLDATCSINSGILPVVPLTKGGLGADASAWSGFVKISGGVASAASLSASDLPLVTPSKGGTGVANNDAATLTRTGDHALTLTTTATTSLTLPTTGTVAVLDDITASNLSGVLATSKGGTGQNSTATFPTSGTVATTADITSANFSGILASTKGGTGVNNAGTLTYGANNITLTTSGVTGVTLPTSGTLATLAGSETLSSKTLLENTVDNFLAFNEEAAAPATPAAGKVAVYAKSDSKIYKKDSTGAESEIGAGGSGTGRNYLQDWFDGTKPIGTIINGLTSTGNRSTSGGANLQWAASNTSNMTLTLETVTPLRQTSSIKIDSLNTTSGAFVETPMFLIDNADLGKPLSVEFDIGDIAANTNYDIVVMQYTLSGTYVQTIPVAGNASTGSPASAQLPTGTTKFRGFFITAGDAGGYYYSLRIRKLAAVDDDFQIDSLFVGPQSLAQGAVVTAYQSYTPTISNFGSVTNISFKYMRSGSHLIGRGSFTTGTPPSAPLGAIASFTLPTGLTSGRGGNIGMYFRNATVSSNNGGVILSTTGSNLINFSSCTIFGSTAANAMLAANANSVADASESINIEFSLEIAEWSSGTTTLADRAVEEYAWNSSATTTNDTTSFGYGPSGFNIQAFAPGATGAVQKRCRFTTPILSTDTLFFEVDTGNGFGSSFGIANFFSDSTGANFFGVQVQRVAGSSTDVNVNFYSKYDGATTWGSITSFKWRVRKVSSGAAVGYPVSARNIVGDTSGSVVPTGMLGETLSVTSNSDALQSNPVQGNFYDLGPSLSVTAGKWLITFNILATATRSSGTGATYLLGSIRDSSNSVLYANYYSINSGFSENWAGFSGSFVLTTSGTTLKQTLQINQLGAVNTYSALYNRGGQVPLYITAVRIA